MVLNAFCTAVLHNQNPVDEDVSINYNVHIFLRVWNIEHQFDMHVERLLKPDFLFMNRFQTSKAISIEPVDENRIYRYDYW